MTWPPTPDVEGRVLARIDTRRPRRRRFAALTVAALLIPATGAAAWRVVDGLVIEDGPPPAGVPAPPDRPSLSLEDAERRAGFEAIVPPNLGEPDRITADDGLIVLDYGDVRLSQLRGAIVRKFEGRVREVPGGVFVEGRHFYLYETPDGRIREGRTAASTLIVERGDLLLRLEGRGLTLEAATLALAVADAP
jgi:hypothetical protein